LANLSEREIAIRQRLKDDYTHYAERCLHIRTKLGQIESFTFNKAQRYLHERLEQQRRDIGKVRALILKGRQQGCSTYVAGRYYHKVTHRSGYRVYILTHEQEATDNLFDMANRFHGHCPDLVKPHTGAANAKELDFDLLDSGYKVGTAGTKAVGRSQTIQLFHGSEVAFWPHADTHAAGVLQAVPDLPDTEIILESTANGLGNFFHEKWQEAEAGLTEFIAIFIPWYWDEQYRIKTNSNFILTDEELEYLQAYGLDQDQMAWRREKIKQLGDPLLFMQEYPATAAEAFQLTGHDSYIPPQLVLKARKAKVEGHGPLVCGADPARYGDDRFSVAWRQGRRVRRVESRAKLDTVHGANWLKHIIDTDKPVRMFVDVGGIGGGVVDILHSWGDPYVDVVRPVNFGSEPMEVYQDGGPRNRRSEMWMKSKEWLQEVGGVQLPDLDTLQTDATAPAYKYDMLNRLQLESKEQMRSRGVRSPDEWDAIALTFAEPVAEKKQHVPRMPRMPVEAGAQRWMGR
jgi:hypothetical protein